jgi:hypothetical protein
MISRPSNGTESLESARCEISRLPVPSLRRKSSRGGAAECRAASFWGSRSIQEASGRRRGRHQRPGGRPARLRLNRTQPRTWLRGHMRLRPRQVYDRRSSPNSRGLALAVRSPTGGRVPFGYGAKSSTERRGGASAGPHGRPARSNDRVVSDRAPHLRMLRSTTGPSAWVPTSICSSRGSFDKLRMPLRRSFGVRPSAGVRGVCHGRCTVGATHEIGVVRRLR